MLPVGGINELTEELSRRCCGGLRESDMSDFRHQVHLRWVLTGGNNPNISQEMYVS